MEEIEKLKQNYETAKKYYESALKVKEEEEMNEILDITLSKGKWIDLLNWYKYMCEHRCIPTPDFINQLEYLIK